MITYVYCVRHRNGWGTVFGPRPTHCAKCGAALHKQSDTCAFGYYGGANEKIIDSHPDAPPLKKREYLTRSEAWCYSCCGKGDEKEMRETGKAVLYLVKREGQYFVQNWPGTLTIPTARVRTSRNNFGARRTDVWFSHDSREWHGVNVGDNEILRCKRLKGRVKR